MSNLTDFIGGSSSSGIFKASEMPVNTAGLVLQKYLSFRHYNVVSLWGFDSINVGKITITKSGYLYSSIYDLETDTFTIVKYQFTEDDLIYLSTYVSPAITPFESSVFTTYYPYTWDLAVDEQGELSLIRVTNVRTRVGSSNVSGHSIGIECVLSTNSWQLRMIDGIPEFSTEAAPYRGNIVMVSATSSGESYAKIFTTDASSKEISMLQYGTSTMTTVSMVSPDKATNTILIYGISFVDDATYGACIAIALRDSSTSALYKLLYKCSDLSLVDTTYIGQFSYSLTSELRWNQFTDTYVIISGDLGSSTTPVYFYNESNHIAINNSREVLDSGQKEYVYQV